MTKELNFDKKLNPLQVTYQEDYEKQIPSIVNIKKEDFEEINDFFLRNPNIVKELKECM